MRLILRVVAMNSVRVDEAGHEVPIEADRGFTSSLLSPPHTLPLLRNTNSKPHAVDCLHIASEGTN
jgi:hypothetical protein